MDYLGMLEGKQLIEASEDFDYVRATQDFIGLKLFPMFKTENMKLAVYDLVNGADVPVMALVHAFDTEARIGDRPDFQEIDFELLLVKEKLNQGEALRKKLRDFGMNREEKRILEAVYDDIANLISRVLTRFEAMADEALCTGRLHIEENNANIDIDYHLPEENRLVVANWSQANHDIIADLIKIKNVSKNKIVRALVSEKVIGYMINNSKLATIAGNQNTYATEDWIKSYLVGLLGIEFVTVGGTYKKSAKETTEYNFFDEDTIVFLTTRGTVGNMFVTTTPEEDYGINSQVSNGFVAVTQWVTKDPAGVWTKASAVAFPAIQNIKGLYICKVSA